MTYGGSRVPSFTNLNLASFSAEVKSTVSIEIVLLFLFIRIDDLSNSVNN
jgi:hypothetical protein